MRRNKQKPSSKRHTRPTIGLLIRDIEHEGFSQPAWLGIVDAARAREANLFCFVGGPLRARTGLPTHDQAATRVQANVLYDLVNTERLDGLIVWTGQLEYAAGREKTAEFLQRYRSLPVVTIETAYEGYPAILMNNRQGIYDIMAHLIEVHGYRRIAFLRTPDVHLMGHERYQGYLESLAKYKLPQDPALVSPPTEWATYEEIWRRFLYGIPDDVEAVVAPFDVGATLAIDTFNAMGKRVPEDIAVTGYDDEPTSMNYTPSLTTIRNPYYKVGEQAVETVLAMIKHETVSEQVIVPSALVVRESCGCLLSEIVQVAAELPSTQLTEHDSLPAAFASRRSEILHVMQQAIGNTIVSDERWADDLFDTFLAELNGQASGVFLVSINQALRHFSPGMLQNSLSALCSQVRSILISHPAVLAQADVFWQQARLVIGEAIRREQAQQHAQLDNLIATLNDINQNMITTLEVPGLMNFLSSNLPRLGITCGYQALYENPLIPTEQARLILAYDENGRLELEPGKQSFPASQLLPEGCLPGDRPFSLVVNALYFIEEQIGFVLFDAGLRISRMYENLRGQLSSALKGALILEEYRWGEEALARERNMLHMMIDNLPDYIYVKDTEGRFIIANAAVARQMGLVTPDELIGKSDFDFFPRELAERYYADEQAIIRSGQGLYDHEGPTVDAGRERWVSTNKLPMRDTQGKIIGYVGLGRDITDRKVAEAERERLLVALEHRALQLQTATEVSRAASSILDPNELILQVVNLIRDRFNLYYVGLFLLDEERRYAILVAGTGEAGRQMVSQGHKLEIGGSSMIGQCIANRQSRIALDVGQEAVRFENPLLPATRSELALPLISRDRVIGGLTVQSERESAFSKDDITVLETLSDQMANAIENARLFAERQQAEKALTYEQYLLSTIMDNLPDTIYFKDVQSRFLRVNRAWAQHIGISDPSDALGKTDFDYFDEAHSRPALEDEQRIIQTDQPIVGLEEKEVFADGRVAWVSTTKMPLRDESGKTVGTFGVSRDITDRKFSEIAIERHALQLQTAAEISRAASSILDPNELIQQAVNLIHDRYHLYYTGLFLVDETGEWTGEPGRWAVLRAGSGAAGQQMVAQSHRLEISGNSMIGWCVAHKQARIALDVGEEAVHFRNPFLPETRSEIAIPLISRGEIIGALTIQSTQISAFTNEDITVLQTMADQLANAITNARLYERTQAALKDLEIAYRRYLSQGWTEYSRSRPTSGYKRSHTGIVPLGDELLPEVKRVMAEPHPLIVSQDSASAQSMLVVPVKLREQPIGAIGLKAGENIHTWSEEDIALVETLSEQLALAAENIRLLDETRRRAEREHLVSEITTKLRASNDPQTILQTVVSELRQALQAKDARILIHPTEKRSDESSQAVPEIPSPGSYDETSPANEDQ